MELSHNTTSSIALPLNWSILLSTYSNQEASALWLKTKFGFGQEPTPEAAAGSVLKKNVSVIPLSGIPEKTTKGLGMPGLIVFECTPLGNEEDLGQR